MAFDEDLVESMTIPHLEEREASSSEGKNSKPQITWRARTQSHRSRGCQLPNFFEEKLRFLICNDTAIVKLHLLYLNV
jgi:hypothetical protein